MNLGDSITEILNRFQKYGITHEDHNEGREDDYIHLYRIFDIGIAEYADGSYEVYKYKVYGDGWNEPMEEDADVIFHIEREEEYTDTPGYRAHLMTKALAFFFSAVSEQILDHWSEELFYEEMSKRHPETDI